MKPIRNLYEQLGVEKYYREYGSQYTNPHLEQVHELLINNSNRLDYSSILDFCAGGGEVSMILKDMGFDNTTASDPFTQLLYKKNLNKKCHNWSFDTVIKGQLKGNYSCIISSFAMHLCEEEKLYPLVLALFQHTSSLVIITPHKRPQLENLQGVLLDYTDFVLTEKGKKVFLKHYRYAF